MQIPIASRLYYTTVSIQRPEFWGPICWCLFLEEKAVIHENIIKNDTNHNNYHATMSQSYSIYFNNIGKNIHTLPSCGLVTIQIVRHFLCSINFWCGFVCQGVFFLTNAVLNSCRFYTGSMVPNFKLQYVMNYSSDFNQFCRFQLLAIFTKLRIL